MKFCQDLDPSESIAMALLQRLLPLPLVTPVVTPAWKTKPSWYQISNQDRMISRNQRKMAERLNAKEVTLNLRRVVNYSCHQDRMKIADFIIKAASSF